MATDNEDTSPSSQADLTITLKYQAKDLSFTLPQSSTLSDLSSHISHNLDIPSSRQKLLVSSKILRPDTDGSTLLSSVVSPSQPHPSSQPKITLLGTSNAAQADLSIALSRHTSRLSALAKRSTPTASKYISPTASSDAKYTFETITPLPHLPNPGRSEAYLQRLAADRGIRRTMAAQRFTVGLLTEMDPAAHTTHDGRTLGLNRNKGEVIELRLRTDAYDGYRDYKTIRKTLCHELAHNVWGEHDARFWKLCREIEDQVEREDWGAAETLGAEYAPGPEDEVCDHGGWEGGEYVLGVGERQGSDTGDGRALSQRKVMARAADARIKKQRDLNEHPQDPGHG